MIYVSCFMYKVEPTTNTWKSLNIFSTNVIVSFADHSCGLNINIIPDIISFDSLLGLL